MLNLEFPSMDFRRNISGARNFCL